MILPTGMLLRIERRDFLKKPFETGIRRNFFKVAA
jgi:hypothetical protein